MPVGEMNSTRVFLSDQLSVKLKKQLGESSRTQMVKVEKGS